MYKGVVFDLDGTLIDSPLCFNTIRKELDIPQGEYILEYLESLPEPQKSDKHQILAKIEIEAARSATLFSGVKEVLIELRRQEILTGIFTRNCSTVVDLVIRNLDLDFDMVVSRDDAPAKPDPAGLFRFLNQWNLKGEELLFVGDFKFDIVCGKRAGVKTALFTNGKIEAEALDPDYVFHDYSEFWSNVFVGP